MDVGKLSVEQTMQMMGIERPLPIVTKIGVGREEWEWRIPSVDNMWEVTSESITQSDGEGVYITLRMSIVEDQSYF